MENKKNRTFNLESKRGLHFSIGLVVSLAIITLAFEWKSYDRGPIVNFGSQETVFDEVKDMPVTVHQPPKPPAVLPEIKAIPDDEEPEVDMDFMLDIDIDQSTAIAEYVPEDIPDEKPDDTPFIFVEEEPTPAGGMQSFYQYLSKNLNYPKKAIRNGTEGKVYVQFVVNTDGSLTNLKVLKGISPECDQEALRVLANAPKWKPGKQRGRAVRVQMSMPIVFSLQ
ncbi:protein TonB [Catalinimonas alkaloidigena]|uniref:energy transducer TonB n=1 Tax=Catalinimonas alkaloidigena TaxID=1075417 RepID=UPI002405ECB4|nr:energy transducer TonB [Catalinimonas alkaloidigena]MDF9799823.1 protein TonB [Catalinimonas alkaloidigena]